MKIKRLITTITLGIGLTGGFAQTMNIVKPDSTLSTYELMNISKLEFSTGTLVVTNSDNSQDTYVLNDMQNINFLDIAPSIITDTTSNTDITELIEKDFTVYPNPVGQLLFVDFSGINNVDGALQIVNIEGKLIYSQTVKNESKIMLDLSQLTSGLYICNYKTNSEIKSVKIIKQ